MEKVDQYKQSLGRFIFSEFVIFISQIVVFFMVAVFTFNFLNNEEQLSSYLQQKVNKGSLSELGLTFLAIFIVIGFFTTLGRVFENKYIEYFVNEV